MEFTFTQLPVTLVHEVMGMQENMTSYTVDEKENTSALLRKGVVGDWKNYFTPELNGRFDREALSKLKGTGLEFDFQM